MGKGRVGILFLGIPALLAYATLVAAQWRSASAMVEFALLQKKDPSSSLGHPLAGSLVRKESALLRAARFGAVEAEPAYQLALLRMVQVESASLSPSASSVSSGQDPSSGLRVLLCDALRFTDQAIDSNPGGAIYYFIKAVILQNLAGLPSEGSPLVDPKIIPHLLRTADRLDPFQPSLHFRMGSFWMALGEKEEAKRAFVVALRDSFQYAQPIFDVLWSSSDNVADMTTLIGEDALAKALLGDFLWSKGFKEEARREYDEAERNRPVSFRVGELLVEQYIRTGEYSKVRGVVAGLLEHSKDLIPSEVARVRFFEGQSYYFEERYQDAINSFESALRIEPGLYYVHQALGNAYSQAGDLDRAIARLQFVLGKTGDTLPAKDAAALRVDLAGVYEKKRLYLEALNEYVRATRLDPTNRVALERAAELGRKHL
jgi:tetratricopeptide (TPR) repeat protein